MKNTRKSGKPKRIQKSRISFHTRDVFIALATFIALPIMLTLRYALGIGLAGVVLFTLIAKIIFDYLAKTVEVVPETNPIRFY